jgi:DNA-binding NarL/FixJ family response regulator
VLIADDDDSFREALAALLSDLPGVELVAEARNGKQLLELAAVFCPEVVLTDINMPLLDGIAATPLLKSLAKPPTVVVCSCNDDIEVRAVALAAGADEFIPKRETCARVTALLVPQPDGFQDPHARVTPDTRRNVGSVAGAFPLPSFGG